MSRMRTLPIVIRLVRVSLSRDDIHVRVHKTLPTKVLLCFLQLKIGFSYLDTVYNNTTQGMAVMCTSEPAMQYLHNPGEK